MKKTIYIIAIMMVAAMATNVARAQYMPHVYINPGHGGHDSDDRNVVICTRRYSRLLGVKLQPQERLCTQ